MNYFLRTFLGGLIVISVLGALALGAKGAVTSDVGGDVNNDSNSPLTSTVISGSQVGAELVVALRQLNALKLDRSIFSNPIFLNLQDFGLEVVPEPYQRNNPFAPVGTE